MLFHDREVGIWWSWRPFPTWAIQCFCDHFHLVRTSTLISDVSKLSFSPKFQNPWDLHRHHMQKPKQFKKQFKNPKLCWVETIFFFSDTLQPFCQPKKALYPLCPTDPASAPFAAEKHPKYWSGARWGHFPACPFLAHNTSTLTCKLFHPWS